MKLLGRDYRIWDKAAEIEFVKASKRRVKSIIKVTDDDIDAIKSQTADGSKHFPVFRVEVVDDEGDLVARINKTLYAKNK